jgi:hypothetical protein
MNADKPNNDQQNIQKGDIQKQIAMSHKQSYAIHFKGKLCT